MATKTVSAASRATQKRRRRRQRSALTGAILIFIVVLLAFTGVFAWGVMLEKGKTIYPNVHMAGVDVGGLTMGEARTKVETAVAEAYTASTLEVQAPRPLHHLRSPAGQGGAGHRGGAAGSAELWPQRRRIQGRAQLLTVQHLRAGHSPGDLPGI